MHKIASKIKNFMLAKKKESKLPTMKGFFLVEKKRFKNFYYSSSKGKQNKNQFIFRFTHQATMLTVDDRKVGSSTLMGAKEHDSLHLFNRTLCRICCE